MNVADFNKIVALIRQYAITAQDRRALIASALFNCEVESQLGGWNDSPHNFTVGLVQHLRKIGECEPGTPALVSLLEHIRENKGFEAADDINKLIKIVESDPTPTLRLRLLFVTSSSLLNVSILLALISIMAALLIRFAASPSAVIDGPIIIPTAIPTPRIMVKDFNIAIAEFEAKSAKGSEATEELKGAASIIRQRLYDVLSDEHDSTYVQIEIENMGVVKDERAAKALAEATDADIVIYGYVTEYDGDFIWKPSFYVADRLRGDVGELINDSGGIFKTLTLTHDELESLIKGIGTPYDQFREKNGLLVNFTKALTYFVAGSQGSAMTSIQLALSSAEQAGLQTEESSDSRIDLRVVYIAASSILRVNGYLDEALDKAIKALEGGPYGRAYLAIANIHHDKGLELIREGNCSGALMEWREGSRFYTQGKQFALSAVPRDLKLLQRAEFGLGNISVNIYQVPGQPRLALAMDAESNYTDVINIYETAVANKNVDAAQLSPMATQASVALIDPQIWVNDTTRGNIYPCNTPTETPHP